jgi:hypothetical protein
VAWSPSMAFALDPSSSSQRVRFAAVGRSFRLLEIPERAPGARWGRAAARTLPKMVGTGCRLSVTSPRVGGIGSTPKRVVATRSTTARRFRRRIRHFQS